MSSKKIRIVVVDDSPLVRELIGDALGPHADLEVVGFAADGEQALRALDEVQPDVMTLDLQMPKMDGLSTLDQILQRRPTPVIVVSSLTQRAADVTLQSLQRGAMDYVAKPEGIESMRRAFGAELPAKIRNMAGADVRRILQFRRSREMRAATKPAHVDEAAAARCASGCVAIGVSTGGPPALSSLFGALAPPMPPIVVVQHMPQMFTGPFANRLNLLSALNVKEAESGDVLKSNWVYIAPGGKHLSLQRRGSQVAIAVADGDFVSGHKPSADVMMESAARAYGRRCLGVIMTGMGRDGSNGCRDIRAAGGFVLGQDEATSDVYGMNKVAFVEGHVDLQVPLERLPDSIASRARQLAEASRFASAV